MSIIEHSPVIAAFTVDEFCDSHRVSRTNLYNLWKQGRGPRFFWNGVQRRITAEAAAEWRQQMESEAAESLTA
jgi:hypothetical protein